MLGVLEYRMNYGIEFEVKRLSECKGVLNKLSVGLRNVSLQLLKYIIFRTRIENNPSLYGH